MLKWIAAWMATIAMVSVFAACGGGGGKKTIDLGDGNSVSVGGDLPDDFPKDFPIYDGAKFEGAVHSEAEGISGTAATWTTGDSFDDVVAFYESEFGGGAWTSSTKGNAGGTSYWLVEGSDGKKAGYVAVSDGDEVSIIATVGDNPNAQASADDASGSGDDASGSGDDASGSSDDGSGSGDGTSDDASDDSSSSDSSDGDSAGSSDADLPDEVALPDDFPSDLVKIPDGARVTSAQSFTSNGQTSYIVGFMTKDTADEVGDDFDSQLTGKGYTQSLKTTDGSGFYAAYAENADGTGTIIAVSVNDATIEGYREGVVQITTGA